LVEAQICRFCGRDLTPPISAVLQSIPRPQPVVPKKGANWLGILLVAIIGVCVVFWGLGQFGKASLSSPPSNNCPSRSAVVAYADYAHPLISRFFALNSHMSDVTENYANGAISLSTLAYETQQTKGEMDSIISTVTAYSAPTAVASAHSKLLKGMHGIANGVDSVYTYTETLDETYLYAAIEMYKLSGDSISQATSELEQLIAECGYKP